MLLLLILVASCMAQTLAQDYIYLSIDSKGIYQMDVETGEKSLLPLSHTSWPQCVAYDAERRRVMWHDYTTGKERIGASNLDGSGFITLQHTTSVIYTMEYDTTRRTLFYSDVAGRLYALAVDWGTQKMLRSHGSDLIQVVLNPKTGTIYSGESRRQVGQINTDGSGSKTLFSAPENEVYELLGLALNDAGDTLYSCGKRRKGSTFVSYYYKYSLSTGVLTKLGTRRDHSCSRLFISQQKIFILDSQSQRILQGELDNPHTATAVIGTYKGLGNAYDFVYVKNAEVTTTSNTSSTTRAAVCAEQDMNPLCPRLASSGKCGQLDVIKYCRKSCLCSF